MFKWLRTFVGRRKSNVETVMNSATTSASSHADGQAGREPLARKKEINLAKEIESETRVLKYLDREYSRTQRSVLKAQSNIRLRQKKRLGNKTLKWLDTEKPQNPRLLLLLQRLQKLHEGQRQHSAAGVVPETDRFCKKEGNGPHGTDFECLIPNPPRFYEEVRCPEEPLVKVVSSSQQIARHYARSHFFQHHLRHVQDAATPFPELPERSGDVFRGFVARLDAANSMKTELQQLSKAWDDIPPNVSINAGLATSFRQTRMGYDYNNACSSASPESSLDELMRKGDALSDKEQYEEAAAVFTEAIRSGKGLYPQGFVRRALCYCKLNRLKESVADCEMALRINNLHSTAHFALGSTLIVLGRLDEAVAHFRLATKLEPKSQAYRSILRLALKKRREVISSGGSAVRRPLRQHKRLPSLLEMSKKYTSCCALSESSSQPSIPRLEDFDYSRPAAILEKWQAQKGLQQAGKVKRSTAAGPSLTDTEFEHYVDQCRKRFPDPMDQKSIDLIVGSNKTNPRLYYALTNTDSQSSQQRSDTTGDKAAGDDKKNSDLLADIRNRVDSTFKSFDSVDVLPQWINIRSKVALNKEADVIRGVCQFEKKLAEFKRIDRSSARPEAR